MKPIRPEKNAVYRPPAPPPPQEELRQLGFSEMLCVLLGMTFSGGLVQRTLFSVLKDIFPYAAPQDQKLIGRMMQLEQLVPAPRTHYAPRRALTAQEQLFGMLNVLKKYSNKPTADRFTMLERLLRTQKKLENANGNFMPLAMELMGADSAALLQMMQQFGK